MKRPMSVLPLVFLLAIVATGGCAIDSNPPPAPTEEELVRGLLSTSLAPGAVELASLGSRYTATDSSAPAVKTYRLATGDLVAAFGSWFLVSGGTFTKVTGDVWTAQKDANPHVEVVVPLTQGAFVRRCNGTESVAQAVRGNAFVLLEDPARSCEPATLFGTSVVPDGYVTLTFTDPKNAELRTQRIEGTRTVVVGTPTPMALAADWKGPEWVGEVAEGVIGTAWLSGDPWRWERTDGTTRTVAAPFPNGGEVRKVGSKLEVLGRDPMTSAERWIAWDVDGDGTVADAGTVAAMESGARPTGVFGERIVANTEQDPRDPSVTFTASVTMRLEEPGALAAVQVPSTPCASRDTCRLYGESTLLAVVGPREARFAVYHFWSWLGPRFVYATPLAGRALP